MMMTMMMTMMMMVNIEIIKVVMMMLDLPRTSLTFGASDDDDNDDLAHLVQYGHGDHCVGGDYCMLYVVGVYFGGSDV